MRIIRDVNGDILTEREGKRLLALYDISVTRESLARNAHEAAHIADQLGFPVVMKVKTADIAHKTDVGGRTEHLLA
ncbi:acetate--CoA ligase family protein [Bradyrhizobium sp. CCBAU 21360]|uniref:acetate--CoA ligase family protein n=1 Tax=Bradyrhizobium sp. CCBAU 21360 TaxID=1325081 RepID=UPI00230500E1|nr:acetate--CoA ligase family protein [Bradyrhizobium sp. CCBAU 21360]